MSLPRRALEYAEDLNRRGLLGGAVRSTFDDLKRFGVGGPFRHALELLGVENYMRVRYPATRSRVRVRAGTFWKVWKAVEAGAQDRENFRFLASFVKPGQTVLDIGAWEGPYTLLLAELVGPAGRVIAFEPDARAGSLLRANVAMNALANVRVVDRGLSDRVGRAPFYDSSGGTIGTLVPNELVAGFAASTIETTTVDGYCHDHGIRVDGMKVDVEGAEALVLDGAREVIARDAPWVFLEFHGVFMPEGERRATWRRIVDHAQQVTFVRGDSNRYQSGDPMESYPDCDYFHALIQY